MQFQALPAMKEYRATPPSRPREGAARPVATNKNGPPQGPIEGDLYTFSGPQAPEQGKRRARGGTRTAFQALQTQGTPGNIGNPGQSGTSPTRSATQNVHNVHTQKIGRSKNSDEALP
jgi:hypothetical protein